MQATASFDALSASQVLLTKPSVDRSSLCEILQTYLRGDETVCVGLRQHGEVLLSVLPEPVIQVLTAYVRQEIPDEMFTTIVVNKNIGLPVHRDTSNGKHPVHLWAVSEFQGGGIWIEDPTGNCYKTFGRQQLSGKNLDFAGYKETFVSSCPVVALHSALERSPASCSGVLCEQFREHRNYSSACRPRFCSSPGYRGTVIFGAYAAFQAIDT